MILFSVLVLLFKVVFLDKKNSEILVWFILPDILPGNLCPDSNKNNVLFPNGIYLFNLIMDELII